MEISLRRGRGEVTEKGQTCEYFNYQGEGYRPGRRPL